MLIAVERDYGELPPATALERASKEASNKIQVLLTIGFSCSIGTQKLLVDLFTFYKIQKSSCRILFHR